MPLRVMVNSTRSAMSLCRAILKDPKLVGLQAGVTSMLLGACQIGPATRTEWGKLPVGNPYHGQPGYGSVSPFTVFPPAASGGLCRHMRPSGPGFAIVRHIHVVYLSNCMPYQRI